MAIVRSEQEWLADAHRAGEKMWLGFPRQMAAATLQRLGLGVLTTHGLRRASYGLKRSSSTFTNILADDNPPPVQVASIADDGIHLADGLAIPGACIFLEGKVFLWDVPQTLWDGWGTHHFKLFEIGAPRPGTFARNHAML